MHHLSTAGGNAFFKVIGEKKPFISLNFHINLQLMSFTKHTLLSVIVTIVDIHLGTQFRDV